MKKTALYADHLSLGAKMVPFAGWLMPLHYGSMIQEHSQLYHQAGIFDVSHMGRIDVSGQDAEILLDLLSTNQIVGKKIGSSIYTVWCNSEGYALEDLIIHKTAQDRFSLIVNAVNREGDLAYLIEQSLLYHVKIESRYEHDGLLAIQGPQAIQMVAQIFPCLREMKPMQCLLLKDSLLLSTTGYTGLGGCEIAAPSAIIVELWKQLLEANKNLHPVGLGARDTLRIEKGYALYGNELSLKIPPTYSPARHAVKFDKVRFIGKEALLILENTRHYSYSILVMEPGIVRAGAKVFKDYREMGLVTSGSYSPILEKGIALALLKDKVNINETIEIEGHKKRLKTKIRER